MTPLVDQAFVLTVTGVDIGAPTEGPPVDRGSQLCAIVSELVAEDLSLAADTVPSDVSMHVRVITAQYVASMFVAGAAPADPTSSVKAEQIDDYRVEYAIPGGGPSINLAALHNDLVTAVSAGVPARGSVSTLGTDWRRDCSSPLDLEPSWP